MVEKIKKELGVDKDGTAPDNECIKVAIRARPMNGKEESAGHVSVVKINHKLGEIFVSRPTGDDPKQFTFDLAFGTEES